MISLILQNPPLRDKIIEIVRLPRCAKGRLDMWPCIRISMHARGAEMLERVCRHLDNSTIVEHERLWSDAAFGDHSYGADQPELLIDAGAEVRIAELVEGGWVRPVRRVAGKGREEVVEGLLEAALGGEVEGEEDEEEGYAVGGCFVAGEEEDESVAEELGGTDCGG